MFKKIFIIILAAATLFSLASCSSDTSTDDTQVIENNAPSFNNFTPPDGNFGGERPEMPNGEMPSGEMPSDGSNTVTNTNTSSGGAIDTSDLFTSRDLNCEPDLSDAEYITLKSGSDVEITEDGIYVFSGNVTDTTITVETDKESKVSIVLDGVTITNTDSPAIYVKSADKVFVTTTDSTNKLSVTGAFTADGDVNTDAVIFSKEDLVLNGIGTLTIESTDNGVTSKDDLKITGGTINITCVSDAVEANDSISIADGSITISTKKDGLHAENDDDDTIGYVYIGGGTLNITAGDDGIHATTIVEIDDGSINVSAAEGIEGTWVQINGGTVNIKASDDGINGARKSSAYSASVEINGGYITISMGQGDTDGIDSNGSIYVNGGTVDITGQSAFDYDGTAEYNGGTIIVNGTETNTITNQFGGGQGGFPGGGMAGGNRGMGGQGGFPGGRR